MEHKTYTQAEVNRNIETLTNKMELLKLERTELTQNINLTKKQVDYWLKLDKSQLKMFDE